MAAERFLVVNADDLGLSPGVNAGIFAAHARGIVTSTSLMVRQSAAIEAARLAGGHPRLAIGLHLDLGQWDYAAGEWFPAYLRCDPDDAAAVEAECRAQVGAFQRLLGRPPTHLDSHQHVHNSEPAASVADRIAAELGVPLRGRRVRYEGGFYGQSGKGEPFPAGIGPERLAELIGSLPAGWTELGCHPGLGIGTESSYGPEREREVRALCDPAVRAALAAAGVELRSFADFSAMSGSGGSRLTSPPG
jgi:chitin disaccharide deacetylase